MVINSDPKGILILTGPVGTGKTTTAAEIGEQLASINLPNAVIDLDWLGWVNVGNDFHQYDHLIMQNLISAWENYRAVGVEYLILARGLLQHEPVDMLKGAFPTTQVIIIRLLASKETIKKRLAQRDSGETLRGHLNEMEEMNRIMEELKVEHATVETDGVAVEGIARKIIDITGWKR
jgi:dephospho-CoA kinase